MGAKSIYCYTVWDRLKEENILERAPMKAVRERLGMRADKVNQYADSGYVYKGKYLIYKYRLDGKDDNDAVKEKGLVVVPAELAEEWDRVCLMINPNARDNVDTGPTTMKARG